MNKHQGTDQKDQIKKSRFRTHKPILISAGAFSILLIALIASISLAQSSGFSLKSDETLSLMCDGQGVQISPITKTRVSVLCTPNQNSEPPVTATPNPVIPTPGGHPPLPTLNEPAIFVAQDGDDSWPGTIDQPLRTIQKGADLVTAGETVYVREGVYTERVMIRHSGTPDSPITVAAFPGETPVIDGQYKLPTHVSGWGGCNDTVSPPTCFNYGHLVGIEGNYIVLDGFEIRHSLGRGIAVYKYNGSPTEAIIKNNNVHDNRDVGILMHEASNIIVENNDISYNSNFATHDRSAGELNWSAGAVSVRSDNIIYRGNTIHNNWGEGVITGNYSGSTNIIIEDNIFYDNFALQVYVHRSQNVIVQRNLVYCTDDSRFYRGGDRTFGIVVANEPPPQGFSDGLRTKDIDILNNIAAGCRQNFAVWGSDSAESDYPIINMHVAHNTFVNAVSDRNSDAAKNVIWTNYNYENVQFENNIIYQQDGTIAHIARNYPGLTLRNNLWSSSPVSTAAGTGDIVDDPQLVNPTTSLTGGQVDAAWYMLQSSSSAINNAATGTIISNDFFGDLRDNNPDIGACENK